MYIFTLYRIGVAKLFKIKGIGIPRHLDNRMLEAVFFFLIPVK